MEHKGAQGGKDFGRIFLRLKGLIFMNGMGVMARLPKE
jgi:hypothetical protein